MPLDFNQLANSLITDLLTEIREDLFYLMDSENRNATGRSRNSLEIAVENSRGQLGGAKWIDFTFKGRGPGKFPPISAIVDWCNARGLPRGMAWGIAKRISESGTKLWQQHVNYYDLVLTQERFDAFSELVKTEFTTTIRQFFDSQVQGFAA